MRALGLGPIGIGCLLGAILAAGNVYLGLKTGWWDAGAVLSCSIAFALLRAAGRSPVPRDVVLVQTIAASAAAMPSVAGLLGAWPALAMLGREPPWTALLAWGAALALLGIALALSLSERLLELPWPSSRATAEVVQALHAGAGRAVRGVALGVAAGIGAAVAVARDLAGWLPAQLLLPGTWLGVSAESLGLGLALSPSMLSAGFLVGPRVGASMLAGAAVGWALLAPRLVARNVVASADYGAVVAWLLWPAFALALGSGVVELAWLARRAGRGRGPGVPELRAVAAPAIVTVAVAVLALGLPLGPAVLGTLLFLALGPLTARLAGETDLAPFAQMGQAAQGVTAIAAPALSAAGNVAAGSVAAGAAAQTVYTLASLKVARLCGLPRRPQVIGQLLGAAVGLVVLVPAYRLLVHAYGLGSPLLPAPAALGWKALAEVAAEGTRALPPGALEASAIALGCGIALALLERTRAGRFLPSPFALSVALLVPATASAAILFGALARAWLARARPGLEERVGAAAASGAIAGEAVAGILVAAYAGLR